MNEQAPSILIIDNDEGMVMALSSRLEYMGYRCTTAGTGSQGLALFGEHHFDLVITDLNMPSGNGISLIESIRTHSKIPVIVVTGFTGEFGRDLAALGGISILKKPFHTDQLLEMLEIELAMVGVMLPTGVGDPDQGDDGFDQ